MTPLVRDTERSFAGTTHPMAILLCRTPQGNFHLGILVADDSRTTHTIDLAWEDMVRFDAWQEPWLWAVPEVDDESLAQVRALALRVVAKWQATRRLPYGLVYGGSTFDPRDGSVCLAPQGCGLSCATFVLALFETQGITLVDEASWPVRQEDDLVWLAGLESLASAPLYQRLSGEIAGGVKRVRPNEVAAACAVDHERATFTEVCAHLPAVDSLIDEVFRS